MANTYELNMHKSLCSSAYKTLNEQYLYQW